MTDSFERHAANPLITAADLPYPANTVFNAGAADLGDEILLLLRVEGRSGRSHLTVARSKNGLDAWRFETPPILHPDDGDVLEEYGLEDARITRLEDDGVWAMTFTDYSRYGPAVALATSPDFRAIDRKGVLLPPNNKDAALFPRTFDGRYALLHRPTGREEGMWIAYSPDLIHWGDHRPLLSPRPGAAWDSRKVGVGPQPIETDAGWLVIYHGVKQTGSGLLYRVGVLLLDRDDPSRLIGRSKGWLFGPEAPYERAGDVPNAVFPCGAFVRDGTVWMYYGAADTSICLATASLDDLIAAATG